MTIKKKMMVMGGISILIFACLFVINMETYHKYQENIQARENATRKLSEIEEFAEWKRTVVSLVDNIASSGHVPEDFQNPFAPPSDLLKEESEVLIRSGKSLIDQIQNKEKKELELREKFVSKRLQINELYRQLDAEIATVLAKAELAQVLGGDAAKDSSLAAYFLKSLNQVTLVALNALISKQLPEKEKGVLEKNKQFITSQIKSFTGSEQIPHLFQELFSQADSLDGFITRSDQELSDMEQHISAAKSEFENAVEATHPEQMIAKAKSEADRANQALEKAARFNLLAMSLFLVVGLFAVIGVIWFIFSRVLNPIQRVSSGLSKTADQLAYAAEQVSGSSHSVAQGAASQASSSEEISSSLEEVSSMSRQNSEKATQMDTFMTDLKKTVREANTAMNLLSESIEDISKTTDATSGIIKSIEEVAFQTNLLSLNAAVEAARAGEGGAGFAVVAEEVRSLAAKTAELAKNTSELLARIIQKIGDGSGVLEDTNKKFSEIVSGSMNAATLVSEISAFSSEQTEGIEQVSKGVFEIDRVAQENAGSAEEYASISGELGAQAEDMKMFVEDLIQIIGKGRRQS